MPERGYRGGLRRRGPPARRRRTQKGGGCCYLRSPPASEHRRHAAKHLHERAGEDQAKTSARRVTSNASRRPLLREIGVEAGEREFAEGRVHRVAEDGVDEVGVAVGGVGEQLVPVPE